jgi:large subunit ribosomal protein L13
MATHIPNPAEIKRSWLLIDLEGQTVGRAASKIAGLLRGKHKVEFTPHLDVGDYVICINADKVKFTGQKLDQQTYSKFTGYLGNMKTRTAREMLARKPEVVIRSAVKRMLPRSPLGRQTVAKLKVYAGSEHPHQAQNPTPHKL